MVAAPRMAVELAAMLLGILVACCVSPSTCWSATRLPLGRSGSVAPAGRSTTGLLRAGPAVDDLEETTESLMDSVPETTTSSSLSSVLFPPNRQVLEFVEPKTNVTVMLIGAMHYNPASINLVETTVDKLGASDKLASVIIESCDIRWNKTQEMMDKKQQQQQQRQSPAKNPPTPESARSFIESNPNEKDFLGNEMRAAWEVATRYSRPTVLGDQRINITIDALKASLKETAKDVFLGGPDGWKRSRDEIATNWEKTIPLALGTSQPAAAASSPAYLNAFAFFDPRLLISLPVSLVKYPLSFLVKDPIPVGTVFCLLAYLNFYGGGDGSLDADSLADLWASATTPRDYPWTDYAVSFLVALLETIVFARLLLKPLLAERNEVLARSVLEQCKLYAAANNDAAAPAAPSWWDVVRTRLAEATAAPARNNDAAASADDDIVYVPGSDPASLSDGSNDGGRVVVAVLGMAHCNGVMKLLREQAV